VTELDYVTMAPVWPRHDKSSSPPCRQMVDYWQPASQRPGSGVPSLRGGCNERGHILVESHLAGIGFDIVVRAQRVIDRSAFPCRK
jgi:hypothetical protein